MRTGPIILRRFIALGPLSGRLTRRTRATFCSIEPSRFSVANCDSYASLSTRRLQILTETFTSVPGDASRMRTGRMTGTVAGPVEATRYTSNSKLR